MSKKQAFIDKFKKIFPYGLTLLIYLFFYGFMLIKYNVIYDYCVQSLLFSVFLLTLLYLVFLGIFKKSSISNVIMLSFLGIFSIINLFKVYYTNDPILFSDVLFINNSSEILSILDGTILNAILHNLIPIIIYVGGSIGLGFLAFKNEYTVENKLVRICFGIIPTIIIILLLFPSRNFRNFMLYDFYNINDRKDFYSATSNLKYYSKYGTFSGMYEQYLENMMIEPDDYDEEKIEKELDVENNKSTSLKKPNIIVFFAESFWDIDKLDEIEFDKPITKNFNKLKEKGISFDMISPSYGGISANVEFEFLTGANLAYFGKGYIPYMQLYNDDSYYNRPSIINELKNNDYYTKIVSYTSDSLFNCGKFYKYIDVDETSFNPNVNKKYLKGKYVSDEHIVDEIIEEFDNKEKDKLEFYMTLSMQAHMPYTIDKYKDYDIKLEKSNFSKEMDETLLSYAQGIYDTDKQLGRLYDYIQTLDEDTMIIFYGDHLPYLDTNGKNILEKLDYFNTDDEDLNTYRKYNTESLILTNFDIEEKNYKYAGPDLLSTYVLNNMDINISNYYRWLYKSIDTLPAYNSFVSVDKDGNVYNTKNLSKELDKIYNMRKNVQYKYFIK